MKSFQRQIQAILHSIWLIAFLVGMLGGSPAAAREEPTAPDISISQTWSFGVIADTQWTKADDGNNPNTMAANIIKQVDAQFIRAGVNLVVAVGDTVDVGSSANIGARALYAQDLYNAGIGFYPLRGNHEAAETPPDLTAGAELRHAFPQISGGVNNNTPADITTALITPTIDLTKNPPASKTGITFTVGTNFSEPTGVNTANNSVSYAFCYNNATFMLLDQFDVNGNYFNSTIAQQQAWINSTLSGRPANTHAFVFSHKNILGGNHKDSLFGGNLVPADPTAGKDPGDGNGMDTTKLTAAEQITLTAKQTAENNFLAGLQANKVFFLTTGHDHHHYESIITSPDGASKVHQIIAQSDSSKFYVPVLPVSANDAPVQQDTGSPTSQGRVGYYIYTVDGPRVTVDYYGDSTGAGKYTGTFNFVKMSSMTYSLNGTEKVVPHGGSYVMTDNTNLAATMESGFLGTSLSILAGTNGSTAKTNYGKAVVNDVTTAWTAAAPGLASDILSLHGMNRTLTSTLTDPYVVSLNYQPGKVSSSVANSGKFGLLSRNSQGQWVLAASQAISGTVSFVSGPWTASYPVGTYGVDPATNTAWAVLNYNSNFAVGIPGWVALPTVVKKNAN